MEMSYQSKEGYPKGAIRVPNPVPTGLFFGYPLYLKDRAKMSPLPPLDSSKNLQAYTNTL